MKAHSGYSMNICHSDADMNTSDTSVQMGLRNNTKLLEPHEEHYSKYTIWLLSHT